MKVSYLGKLKKVNAWPKDMDDFRKSVSRKFTEKKFDEALALLGNVDGDQFIDQSMQSMMNTSSFKNFLNNNLSEKHASEKMK